METKVLHAPFKFLLKNGNLTEWMQTDANWKHKNSSFSPSWTEEKNRMQNVSMDLKRTCAISWHVCFSKYLYSPQNNNSGTPPPTTPWCAVPPLLPLEIHYEIVSWVLPFQFPMGYVLTHSDSLITDWTMCRDTPTIGNAQLTVQ